MKQTLLLSLLISLILSSIPATAQTADNSERRQWFKEMRDFKHNYLSRELSLSKEQQTAFFPLYDEMEDELNKLNNETRDMEQKIREASTVTDLEYDKATEAIYEQKGKEYEIEKSYFDRFASILSKKQLFELKGAERKFTRNLMKQHRHMTAKNQKDSNARSR